jgi:cytochrome c-type biogenesis protein CcmH/NrfG
MEVNADKVKALYYDGIQLYINGEIKEAVQKWKECLQEDPEFMPAQDKIATARAKLRNISRIR